MKTLFFISLAVLAGCGLVHPSEKDAEKQTSINVRENKTAPKVPRPEMPKETKARFIKNIDNWEVSIREQASNFKLIRTLELIPKHLDAGTAMKIKSIPEGAIASLHNTKTGEPLENCQTPCALHGVSNNNYQLVLYKPGFHVATRVITTEKRTGRILKVDLGVNYFDVLEQTAKCMRAFEVSVKIDSEAKPCIRPPAVMPLQAENSGHCQMMFDIEPTGYVQNIRTARCSDDVFKAATELSMSWWFYDPKVEDGQSVWDRNVRTKVTFNLTDENGNQIPQ